MQFAMRSIQSSVADLPVASVADRFEMVAVVEGHSERHSAAAKGSRYTELVAAEVGSSAADSE